MCAKVKGPQVRNRWMFACVFVLVAQMATCAIAQQVVTESGIVSGIHSNGLSVYKGVPFAAPPVGDLRWRPPVHATSWTGTRKAEAFARRACKSECLCRAKSLRQLAKIASTSTFGR